MTEPAARAPLSFQLLVKDKIFTGGGERGAFTVVIPSGNMGAWYRAGVPQDTLASSTNGSAGSEGQRGFSSEFLGRLAEN